jgi:hypothetical protein
MQVEAAKKAGPASQGKASSAEVWQNEMARLLSGQ